MWLLEPDDVTHAEMAALADFIGELPGGELRDALAYMHDALARGDSVVVGVIERG